MEEAKSVAEMSYEEAYQALKGLVDGLESGEYALEEAMQMFERGQALAARCNELLAQAELKLQELSPQEDGGFEVKDFEAGES